MVQIFWLAMVAAALSGDEVATRVPAVQLRAAPEDRAEVRAVLPYGTRLVVKSAPGEWTEVASGKVQGFVRSRALAPAPESIPDRDRKLVDDFRRRTVYGRSLANCCFADTRVFESERDSDSGRAGEDGTWSKGTREALERWAFWDGRMPIRLRLLFLQLALRGRRGAPGPYAETPAEILNGSRPFQLPFRAMREEQPGRLADGRRVALGASSSFLLRSAQEAMLVVQSSFEHEPGSPGEGLDSDLVRVCRRFPCDQLGFALRREKNRLFYVASAGLPVAFIDPGGKVTVAQAKLWSDGGRVAFVPEGRPLERKAAYVVLGGQRILDAMARRGWVAMRDRKLPISVQGFAIPVTELAAEAREFDLDGDGAADLVLTREKCPAEDGDSDDQVLYRSVKGVWVGELLERSWCVPRQDEPPAPELEETAPAPVGSP